MKYVKLYSIKELAEKVIAEKSFLIVSAAGKLKANGHILYKVLKRDLEEEVLDRYELNPMDPKLKGKVAFDMQSANLLLQVLAGVKPETVDKIHKMHLVTNMDILWKKVGKV